jgi:hypothetical protein
MPELVNPWMIGFEDRTVARHNNDVALRVAASSDKPGLAQLMTVLRVLHYYCAHTAESPERLINCKRDDRKQR